MARVQPYKRGVTLRPCLRRVGAEGLDSVTRSASGSPHLSISVMTLFQHFVFDELVVARVRGPQNKSGETKVRVGLVPSAERRKNDKRLSQSNHCQTLAANWIDCLGCRTEVLGSYSARMFVESLGRCCGGLGVTGGV